MPVLPKMINVQEIVASAKGDIFCHLNNGDSNKSSTEDDDDNDAGDQLKNRAPSSQLGLAYQAVKDKKVSIVNSGCWMVIGTDGSTPYAVRLFPKETCSCPAASTCYHILACKIMIGQDINPESNLNMTLLQQKARRKKKERPSGRKTPRPKDYCFTQETIQEGNALYL